ncbi:hypothetical protein HN873_061221, partial [Arachis hypogaea]
MVIIVAPYSPLPRAFLSPSPAANIAEGTSSPSRVSLSLGGGHHHGGQVIPSCVCLSLAGSQHRRGARPLHRASGVPRSFLSPAPEANLR